MSERLGRIAMKSRHWRWMPGMVWINKGYKHRMVNEDHNLTGDCYPDFDDPATYGCLIHLVRLAHNSPEFFPLLTPFGFMFEESGDHYPTELECLVAALISPE
jgi:hypothetical protein